MSNKQFCKHNTFLCHFAYIGCTVIKMFTELGNLVFIPFLFKFLILKFEVSNVIVPNGGIHSSWCGEHTSIYRMGARGGGA